jgi:hypothetical protein
MGTGGLEAEGAVRKERTEERDEHPSGRLYRFCQQPLKQISNSPYQLFLSGRKISTA